LENDDPGLRPRRCSFVVQLRRDEVSDALSLRSLLPFIEVQISLVQDRAAVRRRRHDLDGEIEILERFASQRHAPGALPSKLATRLE
jgi:hypothetical protein